MPIECQDAQTFRSRDSSQQSKPTDAVLMPPPSQETVSEDPHSPVASRDRDLSSSSPARAQSHDSSPQEETHPSEADCVVDPSQQCTQGSAGSMEMWERVDEIKDMYGVLFKRLVEQLHALDRIQAAHEAYWAKLLSNLDESAVQQEELERSLKEKMQPIKSVLQQHSLTRASMSLVKETALYPRRLDSASTDDTLTGMQETEPSESQGFMQGSMLPMRASKQRLNFPLSDDQFEDGGDDTCFAQPEPPSQSHQMKRKQPPIMYAASGKPGPRYPPSKRTDYAMVTPDKMLQGKGGCQQAEDDDDTQGQGRAEFYEYHHGMM